MGFMDHPSYGSIQYEATSISDDPDTQVAQTCALMAKYVREDADSPEILTDCIEASGSTDPATIAADCWAFVRGRIQFVNDEVTAQPFTGMFRDGIVETLVRPRDMSAMQGKRTGDCDDFSMYLAALLTANNIPCKFVTLAADPADPSRYSHVYVAAYIDGQRLPLDASHGPHAGWEAPNKFWKRAEWPIAYGFPWEAAFVIGSLLVLAVACR